MPHAANRYQRSPMDLRMAPWSEETLFVTYCAGPHCNGAARGALRLARLGRPVKIMAGGITGWVDERFALQTGRGHGSPTESLSAGLPFTLSYLPIRADHDRSATAMLQGLPHSVPSGAQAYAPAHACGYAPTRAQYAHAGNGEPFTDLWASHRSWTAIAGRKITSRINLPSTSVLVARHTRR